MAIQLLDTDTINKIAAGEVVERPASVVKELVENSIDAGASQISVNATDGGITSIRVSDNGSGIAYEDLARAFKEHATSKISTISDLDQVASLGFRGEALSSIASIAKVELTSKENGALSAYLYKIEAGKELGIEEIGASEGTSMLVEDIFFNTPVRKKFLKSNTAEGAAITQLMERFALSNPNIAFTYKLNGKEKLKTSGNGNLKEIIFKIYGRDIANNLIEINESSEDISIRGFIGKPIISRGNRSFENYAVNGRYIKNDALTEAIEEAYRGFIMLHNYPFTALLFEIKPSLLDVNVHPAKREFRMTAADSVCLFTKEKIKEAITKSDLIPDLKPDMITSAEKNNTLSSSILESIIEDDLNADEYKEIKQVEDIVSDISPIYGNNIDKVVTDDKELLNNNNFSNGFSKTLDNDISLSSKQTLNNDAPLSSNEALNNDIASFSKQALESDNINEDNNQLNNKVNPFDEVVDKKTFLQVEIDEVSNKKHYKLLGQLFATYWLIEEGNNFYMMDQHAAHEKILYEKLMKKAASKEVAIQYLTLPIMIEVSPETAALLEEESILYEAFINLGYEMEAFGDNTIKVTGIPAMLPTTDYKKMITDMLDILLSKGTASLNATDAPQLLLEKIASMSCKAAIKGHDKITEWEAYELIEDLMKADNPYNCPHGRPTLISMSKYEIEKKFGRIV